MADETKSKVKEPAKGTYEYTLKRDYAEDLEAHDEYIRDFDAYEAMVMSKTYDAVSKQTKSGITDGATTTLYIERAARVVGQLPSGTVKAAGKKDTGKAALMDIIRQKWIYPNANAQHPFLIKLRLWQFYSSVYGFMPMFYDWHVSPTGYVGPDCWLWNPRNFIPQAGRTSISDMDYAHAIAYITPKFLEDLLDEDDDSGWDKTAIQQSIGWAKNALKEPENERDTYISRTRGSGSTRQLPLVTRYEAGEDGKWITFLPDNACTVLREIKNPHKSNKIPFVIKYAQPLFDSFYGLGDFQRSKPIQFAKDGLTNFYFEGIKSNIYPAMVVNATGVVKHTVDQRPGAIIQETIPNSVRWANPSTAGLSTYQSAMSQLSGSLQNLAGTTDTSINAEAALNPAYGKTPEALRQLSARESTRDNQDRFFMEQAIEELIDGMQTLIPNVATETMSLDMFVDEVKAIKESGHTDVLEMLKVSESGQSAKLDIKPSELKGVAYRFNIEQGTTDKADKDAQKQSLLDFLGVVGKFQNELGELRQMGWGLDWKQIFTAYGNLSDVPGFDKIFTQVQAPPQQATPAGTPPPGVMPQGGQPVPPEGTPPSPSPIAPMTVAGMRFNNPELAAQAEQLVAMSQGEGGQGAY